MASNSDSDLLFSIDMSPLATSPLSSFPPHTSSARGSPYHLPPTSSRNQNRLNGRTNVSATATARGTETHMRHTVPARASVRHTNAPASADYRRSGAAAPAHTAATDAQFMYSLPRSLTPHPLLARAQQNPNSTSPITSSSPVTKPKKASLSTTKRTGTTTKSSFGYRHNQGADAREAYPSPPTSSSDSPSPS